MTSTRWIVGTLLVALGAVGMGGCYYDFGDDRSASPPPPPSYGSTAPTNATRWTAQADTFRGDLGNVLGFGGMAATVAGSNYGTASSSVRIDAENTSARWWAMTLLNVSGSMRHPSLVPGAHLVFNNRTRPASSTPSDAALFVTAMGCSGPRLNQYTYDHNAEEIVVDVAAGPTDDTRRFSFDARFAGPGGEQHVTGSFVYDVQ
jgi:hypothetical protein